MPRYYFHLTDGKETVKNPEGMDLPGTAAAREEAMVLARDLKHGKVMPRRSWNGWMVSVVDQHGHEVEAVSTNDGPPSRQRAVPLRALGPIRGGREQPIGARPQSDMLADANRFVTRRTDLDEVLAVALSQRDFQAPRRPKAVDALDDAVEHGAARFRHDRDLVGPDEEAGLAIGQSVRIEVEPAAGEVNAPAVDGDRDAQRLADEMMHERALGLFVHLFGRADLLDASLGEHDDPVGELQRLLLIVRHEHRGNVDLLVQLTKPAPQLLAHLGVERAERLVEQQNAGLDGARERDALALAAGQLVRQPLPERAELHQLEQLIYPRANRGLGRTQTARARTQSERNILEHRHVTEKRVVLEHETDIALADTARQRVLAVEMDLALIGPVQSGDDTQQRGLARSGWNERRDQLARVNVEIDVVEGGKGSKAPGHLVQSDLHPFTPLPRGLPASPWRRASPAPAAPAAT